MVVCCTHTTIKVYTISKLLAIINMKTQRFRLKFSKMTGTSHRPMYTKRLPTVAESNALMAHRANISTTPMTIQIARFLKRLFNVLFPESHCGLYATDRF